MIIKNLLQPRNETPPPPPPEVIPNQFYRDLPITSNISSITGKYISPETAKTISTAFRCGNILSDDIASMPLQMFSKVSNTIERILPDGFMRNIAYLLEVQPNRWMVPAIFKKTVVMWLVFWGDAYIWQPLSRYREIYILDSSMTYPVFDTSGNLWYQTTFPSRQTKLLPDVEVAHLMINSTNGLSGRSVISYGMETFARQLGQHETQNRLIGKGVMPAAILWGNGELNKDARDKIRTSYTEGVSGSGNAGSVAVFDSKIAKWEPVTMKATDAQLLETVEATDSEIANFFGVPLYKLNAGKQSYESNEQQDLDYLKTTLNPYLVQWEQVARLKWLSEAERAITYFKFNRAALLQTSATVRAAYNEKLIFSGQLSPNEARENDDLSAYPEGDGHYIPGNMTLIGAPQNVNPPL